MKFETWEPIYNDILDDFGFLKKDDELARDILVKMNPKMRIGNLKKFRNSKVAIAGGASCIENELDIFENVDYTVAVSTAADILLREEIRIDMMVTDLDKNPATTKMLNDLKIPIAVAGHGDNIEELKKWVPRLNLNYVIGTTQVEPMDNIVNYGGFTDGDRAAFMVDFLGAKEILFAGWDFDDNSVSKKKKKKLKWAEYLLRWLEISRGQKFTILNNRRGNGL